MESRRHFTVSHIAAKKAVIAAFSHPEFKKRWLRCVHSTEHERLLTQFKQAVVAQQEKSSKKIPESQNSEKRKRKEFYDFGSDSGEEGGDSTDPNLNKTSIEILKYFDDKCTDLDRLISFYKKSFFAIQYPVTLLCSCGETIFICNNVKYTKE